MMNLTRNVTTVQVDCVLYLLIVFLQALEIVDGPLTIFGDFLGNDQLTTISGFAVRFPPFTLDS